MGVLCEEHLASSLLDAMEQPLALALRVVEYRSYERAKAMVDNTKKAENLPDHPMIDLVQEVEHLRAVAKRDAIRLGNTNS